MNVVKTETMVILLSDGWLMGIKRKEVKWN